MADINVTGTGTFAANNFTVPLTDSDVTFHSANSAVVICFSNSTTFGQNSLSVGSGGQPTPLTIQARDNVTFTVHVSTYTDCDSANLGDDTTYTIDMSTSTGHDQVQTAKY